MESVLRRLIRGSRLSLGHIPDSSASYSMGLFAGLLGRMSFDEFDAFVHYLIELEHFRATVTGLHASDQDPREFLYRFWQRFSDACPLECSEAEAMENDFRKWVDERVWEIDFDIPVGCSEYGGATGPAGDSCGVTGAASSSSGWFRRAYRRLVNLLSNG